MGSKGSLKDTESADQRQERQRQQVLENVPDGVTIQRLAYPVQVGDRIQMSDVVLLGVKQRTLVHASYVYDFLETIKPETVFC